MRRFVVVGLSAWLFVGCLGDPVGPGGVLVVERLGGALDSLVIGAPGRPLGSLITLQVRDGAGRPVAGAVVRWTVVAGNGQIVDHQDLTGPDGIVRGVWVLGTRAADAQRLMAEAQIGSEVAPGIWRMLFTADGRGSPGDRRAIWSAVSLDRVSWRLEGEILGGSDYNIYYVALAGDLAVFVRQDPIGTFRLAAATVAMP